MAARIYPILSQTETLTIWMKSLVLQSHGMTVYNSRGEIVYRVDNYGEICSSEVRLIDLQGNVLFTIRKKKLGRWDGFRWSSSDQEKAWFREKKYYCKFFRGDLACQITVGENKYWMKRSGQKVAFRMVDNNGDVIAQVKQKQTSLGMRLGDDVLALEIKPNIDHSLIVALVTVYGLINRKM